MYGRRREIKAKKSGWGVKETKQWKFLMTMQFWTIPLTSNGMSNNWDNKDIGGIDNNIDQNNRGKMPLFRDSVSFNRGTAYCMTSNRHT